MPLSLLSTRKTRRKEGFRRIIGSELFVHGEGVGSSLRGVFFWAFFFILGNVPKMGTCSLKVGVCARGRHAFTTEYSDLLGFDGTNSVEQSLGLAKGTSNVRACQW